MENILRLRFIGAAIISLKILLLAFIAYKVSVNYTTDGFPVNLDKQLLFFIAQDL